MDAPHTLNGTSLPERLITSAEYAAWRGWKTEQAARRERWAGGGPRFVKVGGRTYYRPDDLRSWLANLPAFRSTSDREAA